MLKLLVLADDFTGALDTGAQFAQQSIPTLVSTSIETLVQGIIEENSVVVLDLQTRHLPPEQAAVRVRQAVRRALRLGVECFYKKTDSTLRGNIGSELAALLDATGSSMLAFVPAYPKNGRTTVAGRQYVDGVPLELSPYAEDPQNPVRSSYVPQIIAGQSSTAVEVVENPGGVRFEGLEGGRRRIVVFDARTEEDLQRIADRLKSLELLRVTAGCAGFAAYLSYALDLKSRAVVGLECPSQLLIVCGSTNRVSIEQIDAAVLSGMERIVLQPEQLLGWSAEETEALFESSLLTRIEEILSGGCNLILQTARGEEDVHRFQIYAREHGLHQQALPRLVALAVGWLVGSILRSHGRLTPVVFGGDTALGIVERLGSTTVLPIRQITPGVVLSRMVNDSLDLPLITKAGGFGPPGIVEEILQFVV